MKKVDYTKDLGRDGKLRIYFPKHQGKILKFVVQYHILVGNKWRSVMRFDSCHGYPHKHIYHWYKSERVLKLNNDLNIALTETEAFIVDYAKEIKENFFFAG